jgi:RNA polymerase sigma-70 factor (ECF subfamily)
MKHTVGVARMPAATDDTGRSHQSNESNTEDKRLIQERPRDEVAFAARYQTYAVPMYRYFYQQVGNQHDAEDLTSTTFSKALASLGRYNEQGNFASWLFSIARHTLRDYQRGLRPQIDMEEIAPMLSDNAPQPEAQALQTEQNSTLRRLIQQLPADQQEALALRFFGELRTAEVAAVLGRSEGAIKMLVHRAVSTLRGYYQGEDLV